MDKQTDSSQTGEGQPDKKKGKFYALSPKDDAENIDAYSEALDWALDEEQDDRIRNIALAGPYGSGKSSIIKTYEKKRELNFLYISLARFNEKEIDKPENADDTSAIEGGGNQKGSKAEKDKEKRLRFIELSILQQLFYRESNEKLPRSRFKKIDDLPSLKDVKLGQLVKYPKTVIIASICVLLFLFSLCCLIHLNDFIDMFRWGAHWQNVAISGIALVVVIYTVFVFTKIVNHFIPKVKTASFSFKPAGMEAGIEIDPKNMDESILNKYLDEILYFFERTDYNVVVIEDMDRLDTIKIFTKLRELNSLINEYEKIKHKVVFIYDVCDDLFKDEEERTKFFDFIIPVMPVVSRYNAKRELSKILVNWDLPKKDHEILITELSSCIDGMRLLRNTVNEYTIYHALNEKEGTNANQGKLFALMLYKNSYPGDFEQLRRDPEKAVIYKAMDKYRSIVGDDKESTEMSEAEIIDEIDKDVVKNKKQTTLLVALLNNHYMDEDYSFYIERGHPSKSDMAFFEAVSHNTSPDDRFEHPLNNIKVLLEMLREAKVNFEQECILNYQLVDYLLLPANADKTEYHIVREAIFRCMSNKSENSNEFVNEFIFRNESDIEQFVKEIRSYWTDILTSDRITLINKIKLLALVGTLEQQQAFRERLREQGRAFDKPTMIDVTGGTFRMGGTEEQGDDCDNDERPVHEVTLSSFKIGKYPVTQKQWTRIMGNNPSHNAQGGDYPVESVSWYEVQEFRKRLNVATGGNYRLPTEAEWEYAARGGKMSKGYKYSGSNEIEKVAWYGGSEGHTHPVGKKTPNELGIYDMSGNVWEWCSDWYGDYPATPQENPQGPLWGSDHVMRGFDHVMRGGGWHYGAGDCRVSDRGCDTSGDRDLVGFRLVSP